MSVSISTRYRRDLDEMRVYNSNTGESIVYIQGYSGKYPVTDSELSLEMLVLLSVRYPEISNAM